MFSPRGPSDRAGGPRSALVAHVLASWSFGPGRRATSSELVAHDVTRRRAERRAIAPVTPAKTSSATMLGPMSARPPPAPSSRKPSSSQRCGVSRLTRSSASGPKVMGKKEPPKTAITIATTEVIDSACRGAPGDAAHEGDDAHGRQHPAHHEYGHRYHRTPGRTQQQRRRSDQGGHADDPQDEGHEYLAADDGRGRDRRDEESGEGAVVALLDETEHAELHREEQEEDRYADGVVRREVEAASAGRLEPEGDGLRRRRRPVGQRRQLGRVGAGSECRGHGSPDRLHTGDVAAGDRCADVGADARLGVGDDQQLGVGTCDDRIGHACRDDERRGHLVVVGEGTSRGLVARIEHGELPVGIELVEESDEAGGDLAPVLVAVRELEAEVVASATEGHAHDERQPERRQETDDERRPVAQALPQVLAGDRHGGGRRADWSSSHATSIAWAPAADPGAIVGAAEAVRRRTPTGSGRGRRSRRGSSRRSTHSPILWVFCSMPGPMPSIGGWIERAIVDPRLPGVTTASGVVLGTG